MTASGKEEQDTKLFQKQFLAAMTHMILCDTWQDLWVEFLFAYLYRSQFPWLAESRTTTQHDGLASALCAALATYLPAMASEEKFEPSTPLASADLGLWKERLLTVLAILPQEGVSLERFRQRLYRHDADPLTRESMQMHIANALHRYSYHQRRGILPS